MKTARYWHLESGKQIVCDLCPHGCAIADGKAGRCGVRQAEGGELRAYGYGLLSSARVDPIEKKPLYHFYPGSEIFSVGGWGCNLSCSFCQNWTISQQVDRNGKRSSPEEVVASAVARGSPGIAYTYNEPLIAFEFVVDCASAARRKGLINAMVTNGHARAEPAAELLPLIDALNIDIKSFEDSFYREHCRAGLAPVLAFCRQAVQAGCHVEITNLLIPGLNDGRNALDGLSRWIRTELGTATVLHLSAYHPDYRMRIPPTPVSLLEQACEIARQHLDYVYLGNARTATGQDTRCPGCRGMLVERRGYAVAATGIARDGRCRHCGRAVDIIGEWSRSRR
ncbi:MAG: AmmeMemoRadiSam system radical SAM enzyme [Verrucomicrobiota bacterium]|nr:AmmeMemoRadiSam system radical SAM enzyme [Verrucomicrobiota bacterium]